MTDVNENADDELGSMLASGWEVAGYTVNMLAMGAQHINILLRKGNSLVNFGILINNGQEMMRGKRVLTPFEPPPPKRGFFG